MNRPPGLTDWVLTAHAEFEMRRRGISRRVLARVLTRPDQRFENRPGREVLQRRFQRPGRLGDVLLRVFVDIDRAPAEVVTVYRTSKIEKYWRSGS